MLLLNNEEFPFSMENIPRPKSFACLSLRVGCIFSALLVILYSVLGLAQCIAALRDLEGQLTSKDVESMATYGTVITISMVHCITLFLTAIMLVGALREKPGLMKPWIIWSSLLVTAYLLLFIFWTTMSMVSRTMEDGLIIYIVEFLMLLLRFYVLMLVSSYHKQLVEDAYGAEPLKLNSESNDTWYSSA